MFWVTFAATLAAATTTPDTAALALLLGGGVPMGMRTQRPWDKILTLGGLGAVSMYQRRPQAAVANWWDPNSEGLSVWAAYAPKGAASLAASYVDLSGNSHDAGVGVAPTWNGSDGWIFNGTTQYLTTTFVPAGDQTQTGIVQFTNNSGNGRVLYGANNSGKLFTQHSYTLSRRYYNGSYSLVAAATPAAANMAVAGNQGYLNGVADGGLISPWPGIWNNTLYIGCVNSVGSPANYCPVYIQALAIYDTALTAPQVLSVKTAMAAL